MKKTRFYLRAGGSYALRAEAIRRGRSVANLMPEAIRPATLGPGAGGPVAIWDGPIVRSAADHDSVHDELIGEPTGRRSLASMR